MKNRIHFIRKLIKSEAPPTNRDLRKPLRITAKILKGTDYYHVLVNHDDKPQMALGTLINKVLRRKQ